MTYEPGDIVALIHTSDPYTRLRPGATGRVDFIDGAGTIHVIWDDGSFLGMIPGEDRISLVTKYHRIVRGV